MPNNQKYPKGSEWRVWDLHIHTPASFHWNGERFGTDTTKNAALTDAMLDAIENAFPSVFALQDYFTFDGWFALKQRLAEVGAAKLTKTVFPGIELRLCAPMEGRLNAHVIFSNEIDDQHLRDFLSHLRLELTDQPLSDNALIAYARKANKDKLAYHGYKKNEVMADNSKALAAGYEIAEIKVDSYKEAIRRVPEGMAVGFMPFSTNDGLEQVKWAEHYAYALSLFSTSPIFETRDSTQWAAFVGIKTAANERWFDSFQEALNGIPRLAICGSDAHQFLGVAGNNDRRGYGDFPSGKMSWIKADPTWKGLLQAIKEPANRSWIGDIPPKMAHVSQNKTYFISEIEIGKVDGSELAETWLDGCRIPINSDLVAIIGNKGSGKSALADIVALLGNSQQQAHFSFLKKDRFRGKSGEPARQFVGTLQWVAGEPGLMNLSENPSPDKVELVRYIPQGRFEALCNDHVAGRSDAFEKELRAVIFSHVTPSVRLEALDFDQLIEQQETTFRERLAELRKKLRQANAEIVLIEDQLHPDVSQNLREQLRLKQKELEEHVAAKPADVPAPTGELTPEQQATSTRLAEIAQEIAGKEEGLRTNAVSQEEMGRRARAIKNINDRLAILERQFKDFTSAIAQDLLSTEIELADLAVLKVTRIKLDEKSAATTLNVDKLTAEAGTLGTELKKLKSEQETLTATLNEPQQRYQKFLENTKAWQAALVAIEGSETKPESKNGLERRLAQIAALPARLTQLENGRTALVAEIYEVLAAQRDARAALFAPVQDLIEANSLIRDEYKLRFQANLQGSPSKIAEKLFTMVKQDVGELRGEDESFLAVRQRFEKYGFKSDTDAVAFSTDLGKLIADAAQAKEGGIPGIRAALRKDRDPVDVYDYVFGLQYLEPKYTLLFQDTEIEQLSPGQRGALLLVFYLLVDKGRNPIVLDQPEENLDNETVVSLLVPVLNEAKKTRQILMVTHNPNLAVVCDAEQVVHAMFDRKNAARISYNSGSIEDGVLNRAVVDVLEGTKAAFDNRGRAYHKQDGP